MSGLRDHLQAIYDQHGRLTPALVRDVARPPSHPLHSQVFDKDIGEAAEAYYLDRAHQLIASVKLVFVEPTEDSPGKEVRAWLAVRGEGPNEFVYEPAEKVREDPLTRAIVLRDMERDWKALHLRYSEFVEFVEMVRSDLDAKAS